MSNEQNGKLELSLGRLSDETFGKVADAVQAEVKRRIPMSELSEHDFEARKDELFRAGRSNG